MTKIAIAGGNDNYYVDLALSNPDADNALEALPKYGIVLLMQEVSHEELVDLSKDLPTDTHLVTYQYGDSGGVSSDAVRSYSMSDIFDAYHDIGLRVIEIRSGYGAIKPKLFNDTQKKK